LKLGRWAPYDESTQYLVVRVSVCVGEGEGMEDRLHDDESMQCLVVRACVCEFEGGGNNDELGSLAGRPLVAHQWFRGPS